MKGALLVVISVVTKGMSFAPSVSGIEPYYVGLLKTEKGYDPQKQMREAEQVRVKQFEGLKSEGSQTR